MKYELWFKSDEGSIQRSVYALALWENAIRITVPCWADPQPLHLATAPPDNSAKNGYHLVATENDRPSKEVLPPSGQDLPRTLLGLSSPQFGQDISHLGRAVGQLLASGNVTNAQCQTLLERLSALAQVYGTLRQLLCQIPDDKLRQADEAVSGKK